MNKILILALALGLTGCFHAAIEDVGEKTAPALSGRFCGPTGPTERAMQEQFSPEALKLRREFCDEWRNCCQAPNAE